ncbi:hypothetical protein HanIR_Chr16g0789301 [Helianthus annuus]|nr:hypothetical protein HanIR_Chr16g0789301 [Helianthus annuus]KAJ0458771.1 hypothetical protein HanHA89_Chr16g0641571 [Helianthus annuus]
MNGLFRVSVGNFISICVWESKKARGLNHRLSILCKVEDVSFRHKPTCKRSLCIYS